MRHLPRITEEGKTMAKHKMRPMTKQEEQEYFIILLVMVEVLLAGMQAIAWVFFGMQSLKAFLLGALVIAPLLSWLFLRTMNNEMETSELDNTDEAGA